MQPGKKKFILRVWSLMPEQSEGNNHTSKINVFPVLHTIFFLLGGQKMDLFAPHGAIKSTLWPASRKNILLYRLPINNHNEHMERFSGNIRNVRRIWRHSAVHLIFPMGILTTYYSNIWCIRLQNIQVFLSSLFITIDNGNFSKLFCNLYYSKDQFLHRYSFTFYLYRYHPFLVSICHQRY